MEDCHWFQKNTRNRHDRAPTMWWFDAISKVFYKTDWNKYSELQICWIFRALKQLRAIDDKIIYALNVSTPTASMQVVHANFFSFTVFLTKEEFGQNKCFFSTVPNWVPGSPRGPFCRFGSPLGLLFCPKVPFFTILVQRRLCRERNLKFGLKSALEVTYFGNKF